MCLQRHICWYSPAYILQGHNHREILVRPRQWWAESAPPGWNRVKVSENLAATEVGLPLWLRPCLCTANSVCWSRPNFPGPTFIFYPLSIWESRVGNLIAFFLRAMLFYKKRNKCTEKVSKKYLLTKQKRIEIVASSWDQTTKQRIPNT